MHHVFVILHYLAINDTVECVNSILSNNLDENYDIVIVDNGSPDDSFLKLKTIFHSIKKVHVLKSQDNLGFSKGNNIGYKFAKKSLNADYIIMVNNDTILLQHDFLSNIEEIARETNFDILGPDIISIADKRHQNPYYGNTFLFTKKSLEKEKMRRKVYKLLNKLYIQQIFSYLYRNILHHKLHQKKQQEKKRNFNYSERILNPKLHGSCLIFSGKYIQKYNGLYSKTFMYLEEEILFYIAKQEKLQLIYDPSIVIYHKEDSSTNEILKTTNKKLDFIFKNEIDSLNMLIKIVMDKEEYKKDLLE